MYAEKKIPSVVPNNRCEMTTKGVDNGIELIISSCHYNINKNAITITIMTWLCVRHSYR